MKTLTDQIAALLLRLLPMGGLLSIFYILLGGIEGIGDKIDDLTALIDSAASQISSTTTAGIYGKANRIFPVSEALAMLGTLLTVRIVATTIRIVKAWIPTVS